MSVGFIVCKGLGSPLSVPNGFGAITDGVIDGAVIQFENGGLQIHIQKFNDGVMVTFDDGDNYINRYFALTADQLAGTAWMIVKVSRYADAGSPSGYSLSLSVDKSEPQTAPLSVLKTYSGKVTFMQQKQGGLFDARILPRNIGAEAVEYYISDIEENAGKSLLPPER